MINIPIYTEFKGYCKSHTDQVRMEYFTQTILHIVSQITLIFSPIILKTLTREIGQTTGLSGYFIS